ncbi:Phosphotransferase involved in threonylcarbamoyladenosine t(6)A37 formation in tRNA [hydrothermal vent metagenome]|uniref:Phosphotransferase involved in threonylcarbamoyladenosine t(6)A37 formation in tRNA n=1 Tax=hydrothermal vent metagenome TaxID=652676 RepID=A0A3B0XPV4_9ZZZZ
MYSTSKIDSRLENIKSWISSALKLQNYKIEVASADASFRRYFRITAEGKSWIIMDAPPEKEDCESFVYVAKLIEGAGVQSPHIYQFNQQQGFMQLSDLGSTAYLDQLNTQSADALYADAIDSLSKMQRIQAELPAYDKTLLQTEMGLFKDWYLIKHLNTALDVTQNKIIADTLNLLEKSARQQPVVFVHRDYHSRNLMVTEKNNPGVIDFQDAVNGPVTYDLVSLIKDCYIAWPRKKQLQWIDLFLEKSNIKTDKALFIKSFDFMGMQRHLKAIGIFARLNHRDAKPAYLNDIPRTLAYVIDVCQRYAELSEFAELLSTLKIQADKKTLEHIK